MALLQRRYRLMPKRTLRAAAAVAVCALVGACSANLATSNISTSSVGTFQPDGTYTLTAAERDLTCRRLTGRMQVRIMQIRDRLNARDPSFGAVLNATIAEAANAAPPAGSAAANRRDRAILNAYNRALADKQCPTFDLADELRPRPLAHTPRPTAKR